MESVSVRWSVSRCVLTMRSSRWESLEEKPLAGQWEYFGNASSPTS